jgi:hypothetical protein
MICNAMKKAIGSLPVNPPSRSVPKEPKAKPSSYWLRIEQWGQSIEGQTKAQVKALGSPKQTLRTFDKRPTRFNRSWTAEQTERSFRQPQGREHRADGRRRDL